MCRALRVLCAASGPDELDRLRKATVGAEWELIDGATSVDELERRTTGPVPDVVVVEAELGPAAVAVARLAWPRARIVGVGGLAGVDARAGSLDEVRGAVLGLPRPGGPVRA